jgi:formiminoglutamate deiminase
MSLWFCEQAWVGETVAANVLISESAGLVTDVSPGETRPPEATSLAGVTIPGLANAHSHAFHRALRGATQRDAGNFWSWRDQMYAVAGRLDPGSYYHLARAVYAEMVQAGITAVGEFHYVHHDAKGHRYADVNVMSGSLVAAAADAGIRLTLLDTCYLRAGFDQPPEGVQERFSDGTADGWLERVEDFKPEGDVVVGAAIHSVRAVDGDSAAAVAAWAEAKGAPLHFHLSEQQAENEASLAATGRSPTQVLVDAGALGPSSTAIHATHVSDADIGMLSGSATGVCFCPTTERELGDGIGPAHEMAAAGVRISLGSDSQTVIDLFEEARLVELHDRLRDGIRGRHSASDLLTNATAHGMERLGRPGGRLEAGAPADLVSVALDTVRTSGVEDPLEAVVFAAGAEDVTDVVVGGRHLVQEGRHLTIDTASELATTIEELH